MLKNNLKLAFRQMQKHRIYSFINIFGLAVALSVSLVIWIYVDFELSYDQFHANKKQIYRTLFTDWVGGEKQGSSPRFGFNLVPSLLRDEREVERFVRVHDMGNDEAVV